MHNYYIVNIIESNSDLKIFPKDSRKASQQHERERRAHIWIARAKAVQNAVRENDDRWCKNVDSRDSLEWRKDGETWTNESAARKSMDPPLSSSLKRNWSW